MSYFFSSIAWSQLNFPFTLVIKSNKDSIDSIGIGEAYFFKEYTTAILSNNILTNSSGQFIVSGTLQYPTAVRLYSLDRGISFNHLIFIDSGYQELSLESYSGSIQFIANRLSSIEKEHKNFLLETGLDSIDGPVQPSRFYAYVKNNPGSYVALYKFLFEVSVNGFSRKKFLESGKLFDTRLKLTKGYKAYKNDNLVHVVIPGLLLTNSSNKSTYLYFINKDKRYTLLEFWYTGCIYCPASMREIKKSLIGEVAKRLRVISICTDEKGISAEAKSLLKKVRITWTNYWDFGAKQSGKYITHLKFDEEQTVYPSNVLLDSAGRVVARNVDPEYLFEFFEKE